MSTSDGQRWDPFTLRSPSFAGRVVLLSANTTWQAYNAWGGYSLYHGPDGATRDRAYAVAFDRPYDYGAGAADFIGGELPVISLAEKLGLPVAFAADTDLQGEPGLLARARAVVSLGHDEYWSSEMRQQLLTARNGGTNLAFLGANAVYRHIRLSALPSGVDRLETDYKDGRLDPLARRDTAAGTWNWPSGPNPRDGDELTGGRYACNPIDSAMVITDPTAWPFAGLSVRAGTKLPNLVGSEYDALAPGGPAPRHEVSWARSPVICSHRADHADFVYYTVDSGAAGVDVGTSSWVCVLTHSCQHPVTDNEVALVTSVTSKILTVFSAGPAGLRYPVTTLASLASPRPAAIDAN